MPGECQVARGLVHMHGNFHLSGTLLAFMVILHFFSRLLCRRSASPPRNRNRKLRSASVSPGPAVGRGGSSSMGARLSQRSSIAWAVPYHGGCDPTKRLEHAVCPLGALPEGLCLLCAVEPTRAGLGSAGAALVAQQGLWLLPPELVQPETSPVLRCRGSPRASPGPHAAGSVAAGPEGPVPKEVPRPCWGLRAHFGGELKVQSEGGPRMVGSWFEPCHSLGLRSPRGFRGSGTELWGRGAAKGVPERRPPGLQGVTMQEATRAVSAECCGVRS